MVKDSDHLSKYFYQIFEESVSIKIPPVKDLHYTVWQSSTLIEQSLLTIDHNQYSKELALSLIFIFIVLLQIMAGFV